MTPRQKRIVAILAIANMVVILALVGLVTRPSGIEGSEAAPSGTEGSKAAPSGTGPSPRLSYQTLTPLQETCQRQATQLLADAGLGGTVALTPRGVASLPSTPGWSLRIQIAYPLAPTPTVETANADSEHASVDVELSSVDIDRAPEAAQSVWTAFDVALALQEQEAQCAVFSQVDVTVLVQNGQTDTRISASARTADLVAFHAGELSEDDFINRVTYVTSTVGGE